MSTEMNKDVAHPAPETIKNDAPRKKKRKVSNNKKIVKPGVTYGDDELLAVEKLPFWNLIHDGQIKSIDADGIVVTIAKDAGTIPVFVANEELCAGKDRSIGAPIRVYLEDIIASSESDRPFLGSEIKAVELDLLERATQAHRHHETIKGYVIGEIKGGYCVALFAESRDDADYGFGLRAFLPLGRTGLRRMEGLRENDERVVDVQIAEFDPNRGNIVVSRRELLAVNRKKDEDAFFAAHAVGDHVSGEVTAVMPYGAFISLGAVDGFLHISDISWDKKPRLKDLVPVGKQINAKIIGIDNETKKVKLSIKDMNADPWQSIERVFKPGSEVEGDIVAFAEFGAFVRLRDGVEGLIHVGEITWNRIKHPSQHFKIGEHVKALVLRVDKESRRISLSTKALEMSPVERLSGQFPVGAVIKTKIVSIHDFGLFVELDEFSQGFVPRSEATWTRSEDSLEKIFSVGQEVEAAVLGYDSRRQRVSCSIKRAHEDPWARWKNQFKRGSVHKVKVIEVKRAGVVCKLDADLTGFCPRSQMADADNDSGRMNVKVGDELEVVVTAIDPLRQRISISQREAAESETKKAYQSYLSEQGQGGARTTLGDAFRNLNKSKGKSRDHG